MEIQYNVIKASGIRSFINIHGRAYENKRQVCFVRAIGFNNSHLEELRSVDKLMSSSPDYLYKRITGFPPLSDISETNAYIAKFEQLGTSEPMLLKGISDKTINSELAKSCISVCELVKQAYPEHNNTIRRNLAVSLLFWTDKLLIDFLSGTGTRFRKFICSGKIGYREYAFCCLAAMMGIDVLILLPEGEPKLPPLLLERSASFEMGTVGRYAIPDFCEVPEESRPAPDSAQKQPVREVSAKQPAHEIPQRQSAREVPPTQSAREISTRQPLSSQTPEIRPVSGTERKELSPEEIARLAESVVMIAVHDRSDNIIASGSGIAVSNDGYILTNCHVISRGEHFTMRLENDSEIYTASNVVKYHQIMDLALLKIDRKTKPLKIYDGIPPLQRGQKVIAIGSPLGLFNSVSDGIISGFRTINDTDMIQFTAPISSGSSGGAVLNMYGELIGISTAGFDGAQNINLAVAHDQIRAFVGNFL